MDLLTEVYQTLKQYISSKDRQEASDTLMSILVDQLSDEDIKIFGSTDSYTKRSLEEYFSDLDDDEDLDEDFED